MTAKTAARFKTGLANFFGGIGYMFLILEWMLVALAYFYWIQSLSFVQDFKNHNPVPIAPVVDAPSNDGSLIYLIIGGVITAFMIGLAIYAFIKLPSMVIKATKRVVHTSAEFTTPTALHVQHKKDTKKNRKMMTPRLVFIFKGVFIILAAVLMLLSQLLPVQKLEFSLMLISGLWLLGFSAVCFMLQYVLARLFRVDARQLW